MPHRTLRRVFPYLVLLSAACGGGGDNGGGGNGPGNMLVVTPQAINVADCGQAPITAVVRDGNGDPVAATVTFASTTALVASVNANGVVTANGVGTAKIIVTSGTLKDTVNVTVAAAPNDLRLNPDSLAIFEGIVRQLDPIFLTCHGVTPVGAVITFQSSDPQVATYVAGTLSALSMGNTELTITDGTVSDTLELRVKHTPVLIGNSVTLTGQPFGIAASTTKVLVTRLLDNTISEADLPGGSFNPTGFAVGTFPTDVAISPSGQKAYVTNQGSHSVGVIDIASTTQVDTIQTVADPYRVLFNAAGDRAFVTTNQGQVLVINTISDSIIATVTVGGIPNGLIFSKDNSLLYVSHTDGNIVVLDAFTYASVDTLVLAGTLQDIGVSQDGLTLYVADESGFLRFWNLVAGNVAISLPINGFGLKVSPNKELIYVAAGGTVTLVDAASLEIVNSITVSGTARRIAFAPDGSVAFVANEGGYVSVIQ